ncbi:hypothetical protein CVIRNUC_005674 [Coccomyxa viridis]|uniref:HMG box domain-containing protein n=1 Tax=Coccomyxa viridis TaxID=1274662 RepID=A0AAV1I958_9CHLO|nr:hypothetical protein CVIRNUC_005674 [Coccomyxa viridis]
MLPARKAPCNPSSFFGKNYPRAVGKLDDENQLIKGLDARLPNVPLLHWAKKADWSAGGIVARPAGKQPKAPITAQQAYAQYLIAQAEKDFHEAAPNSAEHQSSTAMLKREAAEQAEENWESLKAAEKRIFEDIAKEDAMRFQVEAVAHELRNPGWFARWLARKSAPAGVAPAGARVKLPMSPWMAFVHLIVAKLKEKDPAVASSVSKIELMRLAMKEASPLYRKLSEEEKARYVQLAEEDRARYERELEEHPGARRKAERKAKKKATATNGGAVKTKVKRSGRKRAAAAEPDQAEAEAEVDTTGLNRMQAWAAVQRAQRKKSARSATPAKTARRPRAAKQAASEDAGEGGAEAREDAKEIQATPAELPDDAYIRTQATGEDGETESSSDEEEISEAESDADEARGAPSVIADTLGSQEEALTQDNADSGMLQRLAKQVSDGFKWLTTARKGRGVLSSMQAEGFSATPRKLEGDLDNRRASKRRRA